MNNTRARAYMITGNNPEKYYDWAKESLKNSNDKNKYKKLAEKVINIFVNGSNNHKEKSDEKNGAVCVVEIGEKQTLHFHLYVSSKNAIRFSALQKLFPHSQIEILRGTVSETLDYLHKRGKHQDSKSIAKCEPVYWGEFLCDNRGLKGNTIMDELNEMLLNGSSPNEIYATSPKYSFYAGAIERTYNARKINDIPYFQDVYVEYHVGDSGTGKTHLYLDLCKQGLADNIYLVSGDYKNPWDEYDFSKHSIIFLDELRPKCLTPSTLLNITDGYRMILSSRYTNKHKNWNRVIIATVIPPEQLFNSSLVGITSLETDSFEQFKRRMDVVVYHYIDNNFQGSEKYRFISIPADEYTNIKDLKKLAKEEIRKGGGYHAEF